MSRWVTSRAAAFALLAALAAGCAAAVPREPPPGPPSSVSPEDQRHIEETRREIARLERDLDAARVEAAPDCQRACGLAINVCALASRICEISGRYPADDPVAALCVDARQRCQRARTATQERCSCHAPG